MTTVVEPQNQVDSEPKVVKADVLNAIGQIREAAAKSEGNGWVNVDMAMVVVRALENELGDSPIVHVESGGVDYARIAALMADDVADMVVKRWQAASAKRPQPQEMAPVPWRFDEKSSCVVDAQGYVVAPCGPEDLLVGKAIVEAINAYFSPAPQPPTPAEAAAANAETQIPDTAGYPLPDYDAVVIPSFENASVPADPVAVFNAAVDAVARDVRTKRQAADVAQAATILIVSMLGAAVGFSEDEGRRANSRLFDAVKQVIRGVVAERATPARPAA